MNREILEKYQPKLTRLFTNSRKSNRLSGAYLLYGPKNAPLKETALYLAQSLGCETDLLACNECNSCKRFLEGVRPDFILIDGQREMIKKGDIQALEKKFSLSAYEKGHSLCYVINKVDNINNEAANAILKFLEEPPSETYAILTSQNEAKVLPTILSRCESLRLLLAPRKEVIEEAKALGVPQEDAEILSHFIKQVMIFIVKKHTGKNEGPVCKLFLQPVQPFGILPLKGHIHGDRIISKGHG